MHAANPWHPYPESILETALGELDVEIYQPSDWQVVLGAGGRIEKEVYLDRLQALSIPLYKRKGGGGTVLLGPGTIVVTVHAGVAHAFQNLAYFSAINRALIAVFSNWKSLPYAPRGISDIAVEGRKIVGSSIFRRRQYLLFQASILVETDLDLMRGVLRPPPREPDYRQGREHGEFITTLRELGVTLSLQEMMTSLRLLLPDLLQIELASVDL